MNQSGDEACIEDAFYQTLEFGTAGLRGVLGAGTNRMNIYTVGQATQGIANYIMQLPSSDNTVAICYDSRINSELFAHTAAAVLAANGIRSFVYPRLEPTPALSICYPVILSALLELTLLQVIIRASTTAIRCTDPMDARLPLKLPMLLLTPLFQLIFLTMSKPRILMKRLTRDSFLLLMKKFSMPF